MRDFLRFGAFGLLFGALLVRVGATDFDTIAGMFLVTDLHLFGVMGVAALVAGVGFRLLARRAATGATVTRPTRKGFRPGLVLGSALFGAGWALTGTCPGTGLAQIGEGKSMALLTVAGMILGSALHRRFGAALEGLLGRLAPRPANRAPAAEAWGSTAASSPPHPVT